MLVRHLNILCFNPYGNTYNANTVVCRYHARYAELSFLFLEICTDCDEVLGVGLDLYNMCPVPLLKKIVV